ncbi:hypothetical protein GW17_00002415 [Ensete ventricosum]|nr:hypothetical protein GW17_00002415 [Ensete ventricosum]
MAVPSGTETDCGGAASVAAAKGGKCSWEQCKPLSGTSGTWRLWRPLPGEELLQSSPERGCRENWAMPMPQNYPNDADGRQKEEPQNYSNDADGAPDPYPPPPRPNPGLPPVLCTNLLTGIHD